MQRQQAPRCPKVVHCGRPLLGRLPFARIADSYGAQPAPATITNFSGTWVKVRCHGLRHLLRDDAITLSGAMLGGGDASRTDPSPRPPLLPIASASCLLIKFQQLMLTPIIALPGQGPLGQHGAGHSDDWAGRTDAHRDQAHPGRADHTGRHHIHFCGILRVLLVRAVPSVVFYARLECMATCTLRPVLPLPAAAVLQASQSAACAHCLTCATPRRPQV